MRDQRVSKDNAREHLGTKGRRKQNSKVLTEEDKGSRVKEKRIAGKCLFRMENGMRSVCNGQKNRYRSEGE